MKSLKELYRVGPGPSSSHTLGPQRAAKLFQEAYPQAVSYLAELYGSLSFTGKGHLTDAIIIKTFAPKQCVVNFMQETDPVHANTMVFKALDEFANIIGEWIVYSVGGGAIKVKGESELEPEEVYPHHSFAEIIEYCKSRNIRLAQYTDEFEELDDFIDEILEQMLSTVATGCITTGVLPGRLKLERVASGLYDKAKKANDPMRRQKLLIMAYAYAASEQNAGGGTTVTAPTLGASGVIPAVLTYYYKDMKIERKKIIEGLKIAGIIGNLIKTNATISGAQGGCQAEIGAACAMAAAFVASLHDMDDHLIEYAAEIGIEHFLGLTCDPVGGYVMIPCIERNSVAALRAVDAAFMAEELGTLKDNRVSFDMVVNTMNYTGRKIAIELKETSLGGLATVVPLNDTNTKKRCHGE